MESPVVNTLSTERDRKSPDKLKTTDRLNQSIDRHLSNLLVIVDRAEKERTGLNANISKTMHVIEDRLSMLSPNAFSHYNKKFLALEQEIQDKYKPTLELGTRPR